MNFNKLALPVLIALVYAPVQVMAACPTPSAPAPFTSNLTVFAKTYITAGASSVLKGDVISGDVLTIGAGAKVTGSIVSVGASNVGAGATVGVDKNMVSGGVATVGAGGIIGGCLKSSGAATIGANAAVTGDLISGGIATTGDSATVGGNISTGGYASIGANSQVAGTVAGVGATVIGAGGTTGSLYTLAASPVTTSLKAGLVSVVSTTASLIDDKQNEYNDMGPGTDLGATMTTSMTLTGGGVFSAANYTTTAGMTLTLDDQGVRHDWVFNIADYLVTGASTNVVMANKNPGSTVTWNVTNGYVALGATNKFLGTILANQYISVGAGTTVKKMNTSCGIYSAASYVSTGAGAVVEGSCHSY